MRCSVLALAVFVCVPSLSSSSSAPSPAQPIVFARGINFAQSATVHPASKDILLAAMPTQNAKVAISVGVLPGGIGAGGSVDAVEVIDNGTFVLGPVDIATLGNTAFVVDQGNDGAIVAYNRSSEGKWKLWARWALSDIAPACADVGVRYGQPESIAVTPSGVIYVSVAMQKMKRGLLCPLNRCCQEAAPSSTAVMRLDLHEKGATLHEAFNAGSFFIFEGDEMPFHARGLDATEDGDLLIAGYGDDGGYFGHSAWRWDLKLGVGHRIAGNSTGQEGKPGQGDGGDATKALLNLPWGVASVAEAFYIAESGNTDVRSVSASGVISTVQGLPGKPDADNYRKIHRSGTPGSLLLTICGLGENEGMLIEFSPAAASLHPIVV